MHKNPMPASDKQRVLTLYTAFKALSDHMNAPRARGYSMDLDAMSDMFGDTSIKDFVTSQIM
jgi:hypothetical protein